VPLVLKAGLIVLMRLFTVVKPNPSVVIPQPKMKPLTIGQDTIYLFRTHFSQNFILRYFNLHYYHLNYLCQSVVDMHYLGHFATHSRRETNEKNKM
jgi:hypothetical protein